MLFKYIYDNQSPETSQDDSLKRYCSMFDRNMSFFDMTEIIEDAQRSHIEKYISKAFLDELNTAYAGTPTANQLSAIRELQPAAAWFTAFEFMKQRVARISDMGVGETVSQEGTFLSARQWVTNDARREAFLKANRHLDRALAFLEDNKDNYATWTASDAYTDSKELFFNNSTELEKYLSNECERVVYLTLRPHIKEAELRYIKPVLGATFFDEIKTAITGTPTTAQLALIDKVRWALARWVVVAAIPNLRLRINASGLIEPDFANNSHNTGSKATEETTHSLWIDQQTAATYFTDSLKAFLQEKVDDYPTYKTSNLYDEDKPYDPFHKEWNDKNTGIGNLL